MQLPCDLNCAAFYFHGNAHHSFTSNGSFSSKVTVFSCAYFGAEVQEREWEPLEKKTFYRHFKWIVNWVKSCARNPYVWVSYPSKDALTLVKYCFLPIFGLCKWSPASCLPGFSVYQKTWVENFSPMKGLQPISRCQWMHSGVGWALWLTLIE